MKRIFLGMFLVMLTASSLFAFDEFMVPGEKDPGIFIALGPQGPMNPPPPAVDDEGRLERFHKFRLMRLSEMAEEAGIDDKTVLKISEILKKYDKQRFELFNEGKRLRTELKRLMDDKNAKKEDINRTIDSFLSNREKIQNLKTEEIKEIRKLLTPEQQAKMILFMIDRFEKGMKHFKNHGPMKGMGPGGGPGVPPKMGGWFGDEE
jgi:Spy/CpxP family protein refolding chaperone